MGSKIVVAGLPCSINGQQLLDLFATHGRVAWAQVITDKFTGRSRGFGFVEMATSKESIKAIAALNGMKLGGRMKGVPIRRRETSSNFRLHRSCRQMKVRWATGNGLGAHEILLLEGRMSLLTGRPFSHITTIRKN